MQQINLRNPQLLAPRVRFSANTFAIVLAGLVAVALAVSGWVGFKTRSMRLQTQEAQAVRDDLQARIDALSQPTEEGLTPEDERARQLAVLQERHAQLRTLRDTLGGGPPAAFAAKLRALAAQGLSGVWLTGIEFRPDGLQLEGRALQARQIPDYLALLSSRPALHGLPLTGFSVSAAQEPEPDQPALPGVAFTVNPSTAGEP